MNKIKKNTQSGNKSLDLITDKKQKHKMKLCPTCKLYARNEWKITCFVCYVNNHDNSNKK